MWNEIRNALGGYLFLLGILYCLPSVFASDNWEYDHLVETGSLHVVAVISTLAVFSASTIREYLSDLLDVRKPRMAPHENDSTPMAQIIGILNADYMETKLGKDDIEDFVRDQLRDNKYFVKAKITRDQTNVIMRGFYYSIFLMNQLENTLRNAAQTFDEQTVEIEKWKKLVRGTISMQGADFNMADKQLQNLSESATNNASELMAWREAATKIFPTLPARPTPATFLTHMENYTAARDLTPLADLLDLLPEQRLTLNTTNLAQYVNQKFQQACSDMLQLVPEHLRPKGSTDNYTWEQLIKAIRRAIRGLSGQPSRHMSGVASTHPGDTVPTPPSDASIIHNVRNLIPEVYRPAENSSWMEIQQSLQHALGRIGEHCAHPQELAAALGDPLTSPWNFLIDHVRRLLINHTFDPVRTTKLNIKAHDLPTFNGDYEKFQSWWSQTRLIVNAHDPPVETSHRLAALILGRLTDFAAPLGESFNMATYIEAIEGAANIGESLEVLGDRLKASFQSPMYKDELMAKFNKLRATGKTWPQFKVEFDALANQAEISTEMRRDKLIRSLPQQVRTDLRKVTTGSIENLSYADILQRLPALWYEEQRTTVVNKASDPVPTSTRGNSHASSYELPPACSHHQDRAGCPKPAQGKLGEPGSAAREAKIQLLKELGRCFKCRGLLRPTEPGSLSQAPE
jgi:hypothetical protein